MCLSSRHHVGGGQRPQHFPFFFQLVTQKNRVAVVLLPEGRD